MNLKTTKIHGSITIVCRETEDLKNGEEWKMKVGDTKIKVEEDGDMKVKTPDGKYKVDEEGSKLKTDDKKIKKDEDGTKVKEDNK